ncbi:hypothetical protein NUSPORA_00829 [Nucleospora cyclopteri]
MNTNFIKNLLTENKNLRLQLENIKMQLFAKDLEKQPLKTVKIDYSGKNCDDLIEMLEEHLNAAEKRKTTNYKEELYNKKIIELSETNLNLRNKIEELELATNEGVEKKQILLQEIKECNLLIEEVKNSWNKFVDFPVKIKQLIENLFERIQKEEEKSRKLQIIIEKYKILKERFKEMKEKQN